MLHPTLRDQDMSFWCQIWWKYHALQFFWWNEAVEVIEATEAVEVIEATEVSDARKITQYVPCMLFLIWGFEASEVIMSVEVNEATNIFETTQILKIKNLMAKSTYCDVLRKKYFFNKFQEF